MSIFRSAIIVGIFTLLSRILGFVRDMFISYHLGANLSADCFNIAFRLPNFFRRIFAEGAFNSAFVPIFSAKIVNEGKDSALSFASKAFTILLISLMILIIILELLLPILVYILAPGFIDDASPHARDLTIKLCQITLPYLLFISLASLLGGILNSIGKFASFAAAPILLNLILVGALIGNFSKDPSYSLAWGVFIAGIIQLLLMIFIAKRNKVMVSFKLNNSDSDIKLLFKNMWPAIIGGGVMQINILIDQQIASFLESGSISLLLYADRINQLPLALIGTAIGTVLLPTLSKQLRSQDISNAYNTQNRSLEICLLLSIPACIALYYLSYEICSVLYMRGAFNQQDAYNTSLALQAFTIGLPGYIIVKVLLPGFFAIGDTKTPVRISIICLLVNLITSIILTKYFKHVGIAIATSISAWVNASLLYYYLHKRNLIKLDDRIKNKFLKIIFSASIMLLSLIITNKITLSYSSSIKLAILILVGSISYLGFAYLSQAFKFSELKQALRNSA
jgi:putative peptidoglycan lipid II flippase